jgi:flagellar biogenesis protein FliO
MNKRYSPILFVSLSMFLGETALFAEADALVVPPENQAVARPISPPSQQAEKSNDGAHVRTGSFATTLGALGLILMIFLGLVQMWKKRSPQSFRKLPEDVWQELGSTRLDHRYQVRLVRVGSRILVLGQSDTNLQTLSEITASEEVANLVAQCGQKPDEGQPSRFHALYEQFRSRTDTHQTAGSSSNALAMRESNDG